MMIGRPFVMIVLSLVLTGCLNLFGEVHRESTERTSIVETRTVPATSPYHQFKEIEAVLNVDASVTVAIYDVEWCRDTLVAIEETRSDTQVTLPDYHWILLGVGVALTATGGTLIGIGAAQISDAQGVDVGLPSVEESYDGGIIMVEVGIGASVVGLGLVISEIFDISQEKSFQSTQVIEHEKNGDPRECLREVAADQKVVIESASGSAHLRTDSDGVRTLNPAENPLASLSKGATTLTFSCDQCVDVSLSLVPSPSDGGNP